MSAMVQAGCVGQAMREGAAAIVNSTPRSPAPTVGRPRILFLVLTNDAGPDRHFDIVCNRQSLGRLAREIGVRTPREDPAPDLKTARRLAAAYGYLVVLKREQSCGGKGVTIVRDDAAMARAFRRGRMKAQVKRLFGRAPGFDPRALAPLALQQYIPGEVAFRVAACTDGVEREGVNFVAQRHRLDDTSSSTIVRHLDNQEMADATRKIIAALNCSGMISLDFIVNEAGEAYLLELNGRPIACAHLGGLYGHDIYAAAIGACPDRRAPTSGRPAPPLAIALCPHEIDRDPASPFLSQPDDVFHDVPWDDPAVVRAYGAWLRVRHPRQATELERAGF